MLPCLAERESAVASHRRPCRRLPVGLPRASGSLPARLQTIPKALVDRCQVHLEIAKVLGEVARKASRRSWAPPKAQQRSSSQAWLWRQLWPFSTDCRVPRELQVWQAKLGQEWALLHRLTRLRFQRAVAIRALASHEPEQLLLRQIAWWQCFSAAFVCFETRWSPRRSVLRLQPASNPPVWQRRLPPHQRTDLCPQTPRPLAKAGSILDSL